MGGFPSKLLHKGNEVNRKEQFAAEALVMAEQLREWAEEMEDAEMRGACIGAALLIEQAARWDSDDAALEK